MPPTLLSLPAELRLAIFSFLPDLKNDRQETIGPNVRLTPPITRTNRLLRLETLPLYASTANFIIQLRATDTGINVNQKHARNLTPNPAFHRDVHPNKPLHDRSRLAVWLVAFTPIGLSHVRSFQLSRHWNLPLPSRWSGHVGFYVRVQRCGSRNGYGTRKTEWTCSRRDEGGEDSERRSDDPLWRVSAGTCPIANDRQGLRAESVAVLKGIVERWMNGAGQGRRERCGTSGECGGSEGLEEGFTGLCREDVEFVARAMDVVASRPISPYALDPGEAEQRARLESWGEIERALEALFGEVNGSGRLHDAGREKTSTSTFYTPY